MAAQPGGVKYAICNADESEPGTFKNRQILADQPHLVLEGLLVGMFCVGAEQGWVFIRHESGPEEQVLRAEIKALRAEGLLGVDVLGSGRTLWVDLFTSPRGYILGEESALIECTEGHRGEPRNKPPFPVGTTVGALLAEAGGMAGGAKLAAVQPGGASSNFLGSEKLDVPLDFGTLAAAGSMLGSGALVAIAEGTDLLAAATNVLRFFRDESCGKCVPCRVGSTKAHTLLTSALEGGGLDDAGVAQLTELEYAMRKTSICGLGQVALGPLISVLTLPAGDQVS